MFVKNWISSVLAAACLTFGLSTGASALVIDDLGTLSVPTVEGSPHNDSNTGTLPATGSFTDQFEFQVDAAGNLQVITTVQNFVGEIDLSTFTVELYAGSATGVGGDPTGTYGGVLATAVQQALPSNFLFILNYAGLAAGTTYFIQITGDTLNGNGGNYDALVSVSNVPLPPAIWLFISALVGLVSFARIRRKGTAA